MTKQSWTANTIVKSSTAPPYKGGKMPKAELSNFRPANGKSKETKMSESDKDELARLRKENEELKSGGPSISMKVSTKRALSLYGLGRFPVTLYKEQWLKVLDMSDDIRRFIKTNNNQLAAKDDE